MQTTLDNPGVGIGIADDAIEKPRTGMGYADDVRHPRNGYGVCRRY